MHISGRMLKIECDESGDGKDDRDNFTAYVICGEAHPDCEAHQNILLKATWERV